ncbi:hypothetical protein D8674_030911 [Pyrus ussuriensis x Pyrus communis]|uniref:Uncharacterized protein n=1 Tax=Pyrus ussuriensis x Pyrus communis TaxID=2448454 RepID=A0A5N5EZT6_9ROSA|nr:hypothetical protein D8674_030911 [Pyrus ussuriensis x Pyrus communis]
MTGLEEKQSDTEVISKVLRDLKTSKARGSSQDKTFSSSSRPVRTSFPQAEASELVHFVKDDNTISIITKSTTSTVDALKVPEILVTSEVAIPKAPIIYLVRATRVTSVLIPWPRKVTTPGSSSSLSPSEMPSPLASLPATAYLPELVRENKAEVSKQHIQEYRRIFREWMQRHFSTTFNLKSLQEAKRALTKLYQLQ